MTNQKQYNVLVLCTGNSARSILGEVLFNGLGQGKIKAYSAGSKPAGRVNPGALEWLKAHGHSTEGRFVIYNANYPEMDKLVDYLTANCCAGDTAQCAPRKKC